MLLIYQSRKRAWVRPQLVLWSVSFFVCTALLTGSLSLPLRCPGIVFRGQNSVLPQLLNGDISVSIVMNENATLFFPRSLQFHAIIDQNGTGPALVMFVTGPRGNDPGGLRPPVSLRMRMVVVAFRSGSKRLVNVMHGDPQFSFTPEKFLYTAGGDSIGYTRQDIRLQRTNGLP